MHATTTIHHISRVFMLARCRHRVAHATTIHTTSRTLALARCRHRARPVRMAASSKALTAVDEVNSGSFQRTASSFRNAIEPGGRFPPEAGRYHLYISLACPWANRCLAVFHLKGFTRHVIGLSVTHPTWQRTRPDDPSDGHAGWAFVYPGDPPLSNTEGQGSFPCDDACIPDTINRARFVRDLYDIATAGSGATVTKFTVPVLW